MYQKLILVILVLMTICSVNGQNKVYIDKEGNATTDIGSAVRYSIIETVATGNDTLFKHTVYYMSDKKKSEISYVRQYNKKVLISQKYVGEKWIWFENGATELKAFYKDGQLEGEFCTYWPNGVQRRKDIYDNGKLVEGNCYDSTGNRIPDYFPYETLPEFPGGDKALFKFLSKEVKYPSKAQSNGIQGRVITQFYVEPSGEITDIKILNNFNYDLSIEAYRVVSVMPDWVPGTIEGKKIRAKFILPISFRLQ